MANMHQIHLGSPPGRGGAKDALAARIEARIEGRVRGRINGLHVLCSDDSIILCGRARTYYAKQLAQKAALDRPDSALPLINEITVG
jgi:hypothetical protein